MFKKKSNFPPRPNYPSPDQIIGDLSLASDDDPVFTTSKAIIEKKSKPDNFSEQDLAYQNVKKLFKLHENLQANMENLDLMKENLNEKKQDIIKLSEELKNQALKALV